MTLTPREIDVLNIIVESYIQNASPVGSRFVAKRSSLNLSPASMRNIMADLTEKGYLAQPHTSAGRIPTDRAFRYYVDTLLQPDIPPEKLQESIREYLSQAGLELSGILEKTSKLISDQSSLLGVAVAPQSSEVRWKHIDFVRVSSGLVMAVLVFEGGMVQHKLLEVQERVGPEDLEKYRNVLNEQFRGMSLFEVKQRILSQMEVARREFNKLYERALNLAREACGEEEQERQVYVDGTVKVWDRMDSKDLESMRELLEFLEHRSDLMDILDQLSRTKGMTVIFGSQITGRNLSEWSIISSPYGIHDRTLGVVGTIGPVHMDYSRLVPLVDYIAKMLNQILESRA